MKKKDDISEENGKKRKSQVAKNSKRKAANASYRIVPAILKDVEGIANVLKESFPGDASYYKIRSWQNEAKKIIKCNKNWLSLIAISDNEVIGIIASRHLKTKPTPTVRIEWVAVSPSARGLGLGTALIEEIKKWVKDSFSGQTVRLTLRTRSENQDFYRKLGFRCYGSGWMKMRTD